MTKIFAPMADAIVRKTKHMLFLSSEADAHKDLAARIKRCADPELAKKLLEEMDAYIQQPTQLLAFADKGPQQQWRYQLAATYSDDWVSSTDGGAFMRMYFICRAGHSWEPCLAVVQAKVWRPKSADPLNPGGWACTECNTGFRTAFGVIIEIVSPDIDGVLYCVADVPDAHINDCRALMLEDKLKPCSAEALYNAVPACKPSHTSIMRQVIDKATGAPKEGVFKVVSVEAYDALPKWDWWQIFNFHGVELPKAAPTKKEAKALRVKAWADQVAAQQAASASSSSHR